MSVEILEQIRDGVTGLREGVRSQHTTRTGLVDRLERVEVRLERRR